MVKCKTVKKRKDLLNIASDYTFRFKLTANVMFQLCTCINSALVVCTSHLICMSFSHEVINQKNKTFSVAT